MVDIGNAAVSAGMGLLMGGYNDRRQLKQQAKLQKMQIEGNKEMATFNKGLAKEMWDETNAEAQREHYENAGLNVGLMYGGTGAGATTANAGAGGAVTGGTATQAGGGEMGMGLQAGMMQAQLELIKAQTAKTNAEAENEAGVKRENISTDTGLKGAQTKAATAAEAGQVIANNMESHGDWRGGEYGNPENGNSKLKADLLDKQLMEQTWKAEAAKVGYEQMPEQLQIAWMNAATSATQAKAAQKNANTAEDRSKWEKALNDAKLELQEKLYNMGMEQRKVEFLTNSIMRGVESATNIATKGAAARNDNRRTDQNETRLNEWREWQERNAGY